MTNSLLDIIGRTDSQALQCTHKKRAPKGPLYYLSILTELSQSWLGNLLSYSSLNSFKIYLAHSAKRASGLFLSYQLTRSATMRPKNINCSLVRSLYILVIMTSFGCGSLKGGVTLKYGEATSEDGVVVLECKAREVNSKSEGMTPSSDLRASPQNKSKKEK